MRKQTKQILAGAAAGVFVLSAGLFAGIEVRAASTTTTNYSVPVQQTVNSMAPGPHGGTGMWFVNQDGLQRGSGDSIIGHINTSNVVTAEYAVPNADGVADLTSGPNGALWFSDQVVQQDNPNNSFLAGVGSMTNTGHVTQYMPPSPSSITDLTLGSDGNFWFINEYQGANAIVQMTPSGTFTSYPITVPANGSITDLTSGPDGDLWFTVQEYNNNASAGGIIEQMNTSGTVVNQYTLPASNASPSDIVKGPNGALWFIDAGTGSIGTITTSGAITEYPVPSSVVPPNSNGTIGVFGLQSANGEVWFMDNPSPGALYNISTSGAYGSYTLPSGDTPGALATGSDGSLWFTRQGVGGVGQVTF